jgi:hypothetical protein
MSIKITRLSNVDINLLGRPLILLLHLLLSLLLLLLMMMMEVMRMCVLLLTAINTAIVCSTVIDVRPDIWR